MPSTFSPLKIELIATGEQSGTWGVTTNTNLGTALEEAITGSADVTFTNGNDTTVTLTDTNATQAARNLRLNLIGSSTGAQNLILGSGCQIEKLYLINNTLGHTITVKNTTGTGVAVPAGKTMFVYNNGTNVVDAITHLTSLSTGAITSTQVNITGQGDLRLEDTTGGEYVALHAPASLASSYTLTMPVDDGTNGQALITDGNGNLSWSTAASGDVYGPASATDNAIARFDGATGKLIQNSVVTIADTTGDMSGVGTLSAGNVTVSGTANAATLIVTGNSTLGDASGDTLTITGTTVTTPNGLNFDSNTLVIDATNNRVGVGTSSPAVALDVTTTASSIANLYSSNAGGGEVYFGNATYKGVLGANFSSATTYIGSSSNHPLLLITNGSERMRITSAGNVGIGTSSPSFASGIGLAIFGAAGQARIALKNNATGDASTDGFQIVVGIDSTAFLEQREAAPLVFATNATERMRIDSSGNVGIGVTPSAWSGFRALQIGTTTSLWSGLSGNTSSFYTNNGFFNGSNRIYLTNGEASEYIMGQGQHIWYTAASGTAGNTISFSERMRITSGGDLLVGTTTSPVQQTTTAGSIVATGSINSFSGNVGNTTTGTSYDLFTAVQGASYIVNINAANTCSVYLVTCESSSSAVTNTPLLVQNGANITNSGTTIRFTNNFGGNLNDVGWSAIRLI